MKNDVQTKIEAIFLCDHRPLKPGESPKRKGQTTMYEATGEVNPLFINKLNTLSFTPTIKIDGSCSKIDVTQTLLEGITMFSANIYKRYDTRDGNLPKGGVGVPGGMNENGRVDFYWIDVTRSEHPDDQYYRSTLVRNNEGVITAINLVVPSDDGKEAILTAVPLEEIESGSYELIGNKVQGNPYKIPDEMTTVEVRKKGTLGNYEVPKHYFVRHGAFVIKDFDFTVENITLESIKEYILGHDYEGIVFHFSDGSLMKVNRGHINEEVDRERGLKFI